MGTLYIINSTVEVLERLVSSVPSEFRARERYELLQERRSKINPNFKVPYIRLEPWGIKRVEYKDGSGEALMLGSETTDREIDDYLLGFLREDEVVDTLIWFKCKTGYDWSKTFPALRGRYELRFGDLDLAVRDIWRFRFEEGQGPVAKARARNCI